MIPLTLTKIQSYRLREANRFAQKHQFVGSTVVDPVTSQIQALAKVMAKGILGSFARSATPRSHTGSGRLPMIVPATGPLNQVMEVEGALDNQLRLAGHGRKVVTTVQELEMQISGPVKSTGKRWCGSQTVGAFQMKFAALI